MERSGMYNITERQSVIKKCANEVQMLKEECFCKIIYYILTVMYYTHTSYRLLSLTNPKFKKK